MDGEFYFTYMFYLYETEKHDLAVAYLGKEIEEMLIEEKDHIKLFENQLKVKLFYRFNKLFNSCVLGDYHKAVSDALVAQAGKYRFAVSVYQRFGF